MLSDVGIRAALRSKQIEVDPVDDLDRRVQAASIDVRLGHEFLAMRGPLGWLGYDNDGDVIDPKWDTAHLMRRQVVDVADGGYFLLHPGVFALATTMERVKIGPCLVGRLEGKSSLARFGLLVHSTAGFIDPGFNGQITLGLTCNAPLPIRLWPGMPIGQVTFDRLDRQAARPYAGKYVDQVGPQPSRFHLNWDPEKASW